MFVGDSAAAVAATIQPAAGHAARESGEGVEDTLSWLSWTA